MIKLNDGNQIPENGFGAMIYDLSTTKKSVSQALEAGYRLIDTAKTYGTEKAVGEAINESSVPRSDIFLTTKFWPDQNSDHDAVISQFKQSLKTLNQSYIDLYLIHEPYGDINNEWQAMEELKEQGLVRSIGVSNFDQAQLNHLLQTAQIKPVVNQIESHPWFNQNQLVQYTKELGIIPEAWASLAEGRNGIFSNPILKIIADRHQKTIAQIILRWEVQRGLIPLTKSEKITRLHENQSIFDFELTDDELAKINQLDTGVSLYPSY
jgi:2,5-diketo-D-gluconate reductase A